MSNMKRHLEDVCEQLTEEKDLILESARLQEVIEDLEVKVQVTVLPEMLRGRRYFPVPSTEMAQELSNLLIRGLSLSIQPIDNLEGIINQYCDGNPKHLNRVTHVGMYSVYDMIIISYLLKNDADEDDEWHLIEYDAKKYPYRFSYALNLNCPEFSELGDVYVETREDGNLYYVG